MPNKSEAKRTSSSSWIILLLIGAIAWYALYAYTKTTKSLAIQSSIQSQTQDILDQHTELTNVTARIDGRDAYLTGSVLSEDWQQKASTLVTNVQGIRILENNILVAEPIAPIDNEAEAIVSKTRFTARLAPVPEEFNSLEQSPTEADIALQEAQKNLEQLDMSKISFQDSVGTLTEQSHGSLNVVAKTMIDFPTIYLFVIGYADPNGDPAQNLEISTQRAQTVANYIINKGVHYSRVAAQGFGDYVPVEADSIRSEDQRIEFQLINGE